MALRPVILGMWRRPYPEWGGNICEAKTIKFQMMGEPDMIAGSENRNVFFFLNCFLSPSNFQSALFVFHDLGNHNIS